MKTRDGTGNDKIEIPRDAKQLHRDEEREENQEQIDVDRLRRCRNGDATGEQHGGGEKPGAGCQCMTLHTRVCRGRGAGGEAAARMAIIAAPSTGVRMGGATDVAGASQRIDARIGWSNMSPALKAPPV